MDRSTFRFATCAAALLLTTVSAVAGTKMNFPVFIDEAGMAAFGSIGSTRNTSDFVADFYCDVTSDNTGGAAFGFCVARNAAGLIRTCSTANPTLVAALRSLNGDSFLEMHWNSSGQCTVIKVGNGSDVEPK